MSAPSSPGPWEWNNPTKFTQGHGKFSEVAVYAQGNAFPWRMCEVAGHDDENAIANARLIAAAPELLQSLKVLTGPWLGRPDEQILEEYGSLGLAAYEQARAAILKATGESSLRRDEK